MKTNKALILFIVFVLSAFFINPVGAQDVGVMAEDVSAAAVGEDLAPGHVSMDFKDADIHNVLRILSYKGNVNIVASPEVTGTVTIRLADVPWDKALDIVLRTYGFAYEREGNVIRVTTIKSLQQEELSTEIFTLNYSKAGKVAGKDQSTGIIRDMLSERGSVRYDERTNSVVVTDIPTNIYKIGQIINKLDKKTPQVLIEAKIIETRLDDSERMGIDWLTRITAAGAAKPTTFPFTRRVETDIEEHFNKFFGIGSSVPPTLGAAATGTTTADFPGGEFEEAAVFPFVDADQFSFGVLDFTQFRAVLEFLEARADTDILSNPRITTLNHKESQIHVGETMYFPSFERNSETGLLEISSFGAGPDAAKDLGVLLKVTPHINAEGDIVVVIKPEVSDFTGIQTLDASRGIVATVFTVREAEAEVMVRDGDTIMLGGLITKSVIDDRTKVPLLGDIPLIGDYLFSWKDKRIERTELIIFITVHLVKDKWESHIDPTTAYVPMPKPRDKEVFEAVPVLKEKKKKWWEFW